MPVHMLHKVKVKGKGVNPLRHMGAKGIGLIVSLFLISWAVMHTPALTSYVESVKNRQAVAVWGNLFAGNTYKVKELEQRVKEAADKYSEPPLDARVDSVWKAVPGYNGLVVNEKRTLDLALERGAEKPLKLVFQEIPPKVRLEDLPPNPIYRGNEQKPMAALMINVAWGTEHLQPMLDILEQENVRATFFLDGSWLAKHPDEARQLVKNGHAIGNHAYHHPQMSRLTTNKMRQEIEETQKLIEATLGVKSKYFAPPSGDFNEQVVRTAADLNMFTVLWTADTVDWRPGTTPQKMVQRVRQNLGNGTLVLMHPTDRTVEALPEIIQTIKNRELMLGTVEEVLSSERIPRIETPPLF